MMPMQKDYTQSASRVINTNTPYYIESAAARIILRWTVVLIIPTFIFIS